MPENMCYIDPTSRHQEMIEKNGSNFLSNTRQLYRLSISFFSRKKIVFVCLKFELALHKVSKIFSKLTTERSATSDSFYSNVWQRTFAMKLFHMTLLEKKSSMSPACSQLCTIGNRRSEWFQFPCNNVKSLWGRK